MLESIDSRCDDYVNAGTLDGRDVEVLAHALAVSEAGELWAPAQSEWPFLIKVMDGENWPEVCGWDEAETNAWRALRASIEPTPAPKRKAARTRKRKR